MYVNGGCDVQQFFVIDLTKWKRWALIIGLVTVATTLIWFERTNSTALFKEKELETITRGNKERSDIGLTFNISWGNEKVHEILTKLAEHKINATFFVSGEWAERHPDIIEKIIEDKHELGMMGYRYKTYLEQEPAAIEKDLNLAKNVFEKLGFENMQLLRTPSGHFNKDVITLAEKMNFEIINWNVNPNDWENPGTDKIVKTVLKEVENGDIILLHASDAATQTAKALEEILPNLKEKGFKFVTITEMLAQMDSKLEEIN